jgi:mannosyltransferase
MALDAGPARTSAAWDVLIPSQAPPAAWIAGEPNLTFAPKRESRIARVLVLLVAPMALAGLGSWGLDRNGAFGGDESATRWAALLPIHSLFHLLHHIDAVHGFYYLTMHAWVVFGRGPIALRLPSLIAASLTAGVVTELGRRLSGRLSVGLVAGLFYAISPFVMYYAQTARSYALVSLMVGSATLALLRALEASRADRPRRVVVRRWVAYVVFIALAGWLNEMALLVVVAHAFTMLFTGYARRVRLQWLAAASAGVAVVVPLFVISSGQQDAVDWVTKPSAGDVVTLIRDYFGPHPAVMVVTIACALIACLPRGHVRAAVADGRAWAAWRSRGPVSVVSVALPLLLVPPVLLITESVLAQPLYVDRYLLYCILGAVLLIAEGAIRLAHRAIGANPRAWLWLACVGVVTFVFLVQLPAAQFIRTPASRLRDFGAPAHYLSEHARPGDGVLFFSDYFRLMELGYPSDFGNLSDIGAAESPLQSGTFKGVDAPLLSAAPRILSRDRVWVVGHAPFGALPTTLDDQERDLLVDYYRMVKILPFHGVTVTFWVRRALQPAPVLPTSSSVRYSRNDDETVRLATSSKAPA